MPYTVPSIEEIHELLLADFGNRFPGANVSRFSDNWKRLRVVALGVAGLHAHAASIDEDLDPSRAEEEALDRWGAVYNVTRKPATPAQKADALRLVGTAASAFTSGDELTHSDGTRYELAESGVIPVAGYIDVDVIAVDTGSSTRKDAGEVLTFVSAPAGIQSTAELQLDIDEDGDDEEDDAAYRARILSRISSPGMGGNANDYRTWAEEVTGIANAYVYPTRNGLGTVDIAALHSGSGEDRALTEDERDELLDYITELRPVSVKGLRVLETDPEEQDVEILITPEDADEYAFDWDDTVPLEVDAVDSGAREITFTTARPDDIAIGSRIVYKSTIAPYGTGEELVVESLVSTDGVTVTEWPDNPPVAGDAVYAGGPLVAPIRDALLELFDSLGPARGTYAATGQSWVGTLYTSSLFKIAQLTEGVLDSTISTPVANIAPTNDDEGTSVGFLVPRQIIVRKA